MERYINFVLTLFYCTSQLLADDEFESCLELFKYENMEMMCCEKIELLLHIADECEKKSDKNDWTCDDAKCILSKSGIMDGDEVDEKKAVQFLDKISRDEPKSKPMTERVKRECLNGQYKNFETDACPATKLQICIYVNFIVECSSWKRNSNCAELADYAKQCKAALDEY